MNRPSRHPSPGRKTRPTGNRPPCPKFLVVCEGQTEKGYFTHLNRMLGGAVNVKPVHDTPSRMKIVEMALDCQRGDPRRGIEAGIYQEIWAAFDWDGKTQEVREAIALAESHGIHVALSNPSFEVWLLWHFDEYMTLGCDQKHAERQLKRFIPSYTHGTNTDFSKLPCDGNAQACARARQAVAKHNREGRAYPEDRPSSTLWELMDHITTAWHDSRPGRPCPLEYPPS